MFQYKNLEEILGVQLGIYKHGQCIYKNIQHCNYEYDVESYKICTTQPLNNIQLDLVQLIIEKNEEKQPFWYRVLKDLPYTLNELPQNFESTMFYETWIIESSGILDHLEIIHAVMNTSEVLTINKDLLLILLNDQETVTPIEMIRHLEAEAMIASKIYVGPRVEDITQLKSAYEETLQLKQYGEYENDQIIDYRNVLFSKVLFELTDQKRQDIITAYEKIYPIQNLNEELIETIYGFFNHNLNVTDTANALFLHRNTLVYRLNKIHQITNLDIKQFEDANKMKILLSLH